MGLNPKQAPEKSYVYSASKEQTCLVLEHKRTYKFSEQKLDVSW